jgi:hypothetical protein
MVRVRTRTKASKPATKTSSKSSKSTRSMRNALMRVLDMSPEDIDERLALGFSSHAIVTEAALAQYASPGQMLHAAMRRLGEVVHDPKTLDQLTRDLRRVLATVNPLPSTTGPRKILQSLAPSGDDKPRKRETLQRLALNGRLKNLESRDRRDTRFRAASYLAAHGPRYGLKVSKWDVLRVAVDAAFKTDSVDAIVSAMLVESGLSSHEAWNWTRPSKRAAAKIAADVAFDPPSRSEFVFRLKELVRKDLRDDEENGGS